MKGKKETLTEEKRWVILNAALEEFSAQGFDKASTNAIVEGAGVSKGLLFHYFGNKQTLYLAVFDMCMEVFEKFFEERSKDLPQNIIDRIIKISMIKLELFIEEPKMTKLITEAHINPPIALQREIRERQGRQEKKYLPLVAEDIDKGYFKKNVDPLKAIELVMMVSNALSEKYMQIYKRSDNKDDLDINNFFTEATAYLELLKYGIYR